LIRKKKQNLNSGSLIIKMQKILNSKEIKKILNWLKEQYGIKELKIDRAFLKNNKDKIFLISKDISELQTRNIRLNLIGMYFAKEVKDGIRLSIEGSQLIGPKAKKNIIDLDEKQLDDWLNGQDVEYETDSKGFVIIRYNNDFYGVGTAKEGKILNYVPKDRRISL